jgi:hypothetical protein
MFKRSALVYAPDNQQQQEQQGTAGKWVRRGLGASAVGALGAAGVYGYGRYKGEKGGIKDVLKAGGRHLKSDIGGPISRLWHGEAAPAAAAAADVPKSVAAKAVESLPSAPAPFSSTTGLGAATQRGAHRVGKGVRALGRGVGMGVAAPFKGLGLVGKALGRTGRSFGYGLAGR